MGNGFLKFLAVLLLPGLYPFTSKSQNLDPAELRKMLEKENGILIDVRSPAEFRKEHIDGAININVDSSAFKGEVSKLDKSKSYFIYCRVGRRSSRAQKIMKEQGFEKVYNLKKGIEGWKQEGYPTVKQQ